VNARTCFDRPAPLCYHEGETNRCPQCGSKGWHVGRTTAECSHCSHPLPLAQAVITG
jgi:uncharacterized protein (DUF983 family)